ncbi:MAG TPA: hypothetical protein VFJ22_14210 [Dermatophilaceae bacterium]|nr:hypothetical protein [Dermatophilaceae bacterium]
MGGLFAASAASAAYVSIQNNGVFELDGNAVHNSIDDWSNVCHEVRSGTGGGGFPSPFTNSMECVTASNTSGATAVAWESDGAALDGSNYNASIFTGGGSKDPQDISSWAWKDDAGGLPDKDNLLHSFAARYLSDNKDLLFFGSDRYDNSGDAVQGYWFFQNQIAQVGTSSGTFSGLHKNGDLLVLSDFSNGGTTSTISVFAWDSSCTKGVTKPKVGDCSDANLRLKGTSTSANCSNTTDVLNFCGIVNASNGTTAPWPYKDKSGNTTYLNGEFFEGGINLTALGFGGTCFASAASETRSSTSTTAVLKDFVLGKFAVCGADLKTTPSKTTLEIGGSLTDTATVTVTGSSSPPAPTGDVKFYVCGPSAGISNCDPADGTLIDTKNLSGATQSGNAYSVTSAAYTPLSAGDYCFAASWPGDTNYTGGPYVDGSSTECFTVTPKQPAITTSQTGADGLPLGSAISDTATLSGTANQPDGDPAGGTITFTLYGPQADPSNPVCTGTPVYTSTAYAVSGDGTYPTAQQAEATFTPTTVGTYEWIATYSGDSPNTLGVASKCGDEPSVLFALQPTMDTAQYYYPQDSLTVNVASGAGDLKGNVQFQAFTNNTCTGTPAYDSGLIDKTANTGTTLTADTNKQTSFKVDAATTTIWWKVSFTSTNTGIKNVTSNCTETSTVTIDNGTTANTP